MDPLAPHDPDPSTDEPSGQARALAVLQRLGYTCLSPAALATARDSPREVILVDRLVAALTRLNPGISVANVHRALRELTGTRSPDLAAASRRTHQLLTHGAALGPPGAARRPRPVRYLDLQRPADNDLVVTWQLPVRGPKRQVVLDLVVFVNGIPLVVMLCEPAAATADPSWPAAALAELWRWQEPDQATHELVVPRLFETTHLILALGAETAVYGSVLTPPHRFAGWPTPWPATPAQLTAQLGRPPTAQDLLLWGMLSPPNLLDLLQNFVAFRTAPATGHIERTLSRSSEFLAVQRAVEHALGETPGATRENSGETPGVTPASSGGVIWHALSAGDPPQHLLMAWLVGKLRRDPRLHGRAVLLVGADPGGSLELGQAVQDVGLGTPAAPTDRETLQALLTARESPTVVLSASQLRTLLPEDSAALDATARPIVLLAAALGPKVTRLVPLLRQALPSACIFGFTSTPLTAAEVATPTALGPYVSTYRFADAIAERAAVPVYYEARLVPKSNESPRPLAPLGTAPSPSLSRKRARSRAAAAPVGRRGVPERTLAICRDLREHFLRVVRPGGGKAQLLVESIDAARQYKQTLDRLGGVTATVYEAPDLPDHREPLRSAPPELFIGCQPLTPTATPALLRAVYLDTPLSGRALLEVVLRVNPPAPEKLFGLVIDYAHPASSLSTRLAEFAASAIADTLRHPADALPQLPELHQAVLTQLTGAKNLYSLEQCLTALAYPATRRDFQAAFGAWARSLELLLDAPAAQGFVAELRWLGQVVLAAAARYRDPRLHLTSCGPRVRALIAESVLDDDNQRVIEPADLLTNALDDKLAALPTTAAKISELANALHHELQLRFAADPAFFAPLREQLAHLLIPPATPSAPPELVLAQLFGLRARLASRLGSAVPVGLSATAAVVYEILTGVEAPAAAEARLRYGGPLDPVYHALALQIDALITAQRSIKGKNAPSDQKKPLLARKTARPDPKSTLQSAISRRLLAAGLAAARAQLLANRIVERLFLPDE